MTATVIALFLAGAVAATIVLRGMATSLAKPVLDRENHRGRHLPTAVGLCLVVAVVAVEGARSVLDPETTVDRLVVLIAVAGFGFLGLLDDLAGDGGDRGLRGHVRAAVTGRLTTGFVKLAAGGALGLAIASTAPGGVVRTILDGALIALAANLANLFDRAPGRTLKWSLLACVPLAIVAAGDAASTALAPVAGAALALLPGDVRERFMLGDTGANALGGALGVGAFLALGPDARTAVAAALLALTLLSEVISFSRIIDAVPPLRLLDRVGRLR